MCIQKLKSFGGWVKRQKKKLIAFFIPVVLAAGIGLAILPDQIPEHLKLKSQKENIVYTQEYAEDGITIVSYGYKSGELVPILENEIIEKRTSHIVYRNLGGNKRSAQSGYNFYKEGNKWKQLKFATTTKDAFEKQTISFLDRFIVLADDTAATSPGTMADDATVGTLTWSNPDNAKVSDTSYAVFQNGMTAPPVDSHYLKATDFGFSIDGDATIDGILAQIEQVETGSNIFCYDNIVKIVDADGNFGGEDKAWVTDWPDAPTYADYGANNDLWSESWTAGNINDSDFGVAISGTVNNYFYGCQIDHIQITITYTAAAPPAEAVGDIQIKSDVQIKSDTQFK